jgi:hypothetical protein
VGRERLALLHPSSQLLLDPSVDTDAQYTIHVTGAWAKRESVQRVRGAFPFTERGTRRGPVRRRRVIEIVDYNGVRSEAAEKRDEGQSSAW